MFGVNRLNYYSKLSKMKDVLNYKWEEGVKIVFPSHKMVNNWVFGESTEDEALLAHYMAVIAEKGCITRNELQHIFPCVLRMLKNGSEWSK